MARISYIGDAGESLEIGIGPENPDVMVGRHRTCGIRTANQSVSRQHARVFFDGEGYWLQDNGSSNGTFYQNIRLEPQVPVAVDTGEFLMCGNFEMRLDFDDEDYARVPSEDGYDEAPPAQDEAESTRFADLDDWAPPPPPPPPPPPMAAMPPPPPMRQTGSVPPPPVASMPPPVPPVQQQSPQPPRRESAAHQPDAVVIDELRSQLAQRTREVDDRDAKIQGLRIELESLSRRMQDSQDDAQRQAMLNELEQLRQLPDQLRQLDDELGRAQDEAQHLRNQAIGLETQSQRQQADLQHANEEMAELREQGAQGSRVEDEAHIAQLEQELATLRDGLHAAQEKFEEARAGRRNAEELANLQRMRAEGSEATVVALKQDNARLKQQLEDVEAGAVSAEEYDAQVAARDDAEEKAHALKNELNQARAQVQKAQADLIAAVQQGAKTAGGDGAAREEADKLRMQLKAEKARAAESAIELERLRVAGGDGSGASAAELVQVRARLQAREAEAAALQANLDDVQAELASIKVELQGAKAGGGASSDADEQLARVRLQLKAEKARATEASNELAQLRDQASHLQQGLDAATEAQHALQAQSRASAQAHADAVAQLAQLQAANGGGTAELEAQVAKLAATNRDLEASASANLKRTSKLMKDIEEARALGAGGGSGGAEIAQLKSDVAVLRVEKTKAEQRALDAEAKATPTAGSDVQADGKMLGRLMGELNGVVSSFRNDFMSVTDAYEQIRSEDADERDEGFEMLKEGIDACTTRSGELKNIIRDLKQAMGDA